MQKFAIFALLATLAIGAQALNCYNCFAWEGAGGHNEACRANGVNSVNCDFKNTFVYDPVSKTIQNRTVADLGPKGLTREIGDLLCFELTGTDTSNVRLILRGCAEALVGGDLNGKCEKSTDDLNVGIGTIRAGAVLWFSTQNNGNGGPVSDECEF